jgi:hypothetical protein
MRFYLSILILFISLFFNFNNIARAVVCAPGDVKLDSNGKVITDPTAVAAKCLYGSDIAENQGLGGTISDPRPTVRIMINTALGFLGVLVVVMIIYGGFMWITAAGKEDRVTKGRQIIVWAAIGAIVVSIAWTITSYILMIGRTIG